MHKFHLKPLEHCQMQMERPEVAIILILSNHVVTYISIFYLNKSIIYLNHTKRLRTHSFKISKCMFISSSIAFNLTGHSRIIKAFNAFNLMCSHI